MIRDSGVWNKEERERFYGLVSYMLRYLADLRDRTLLTKERAQRGSSNWQTDMHIGSSAIMMAIPDFQIESFGCIIPRQCFGLS